ncbi:hypothetical protein FRB96_008509 [Tulasnella sp. 330]|nr:hypothetical protein FRB96_008509 [Tulasnella sp. 330]
MEIATYPIPLALQTISAVRLPSSALEAAIAHCAEVCSILPSSTTDVTALDRAIPDFPKPRPSSEDHHTLLARACLKHLQELEIDVCQLISLRNKHPIAKELEQPTGQHISPCLRHASQRWAYHLSRTRFHDEEAYNHLHIFLTRHLLHWLEVMSLLGKVEMAVHLLEMAATWTHERDIRLNIRNDELSDLLHDTRRFVQAFQHPITTRASNVYTALAFSKTDSTLHKVYAGLCVKEVEDPSTVTMNWTGYFVRFIGLNVKDLSDSLRNVEEGPRECSTGLYSDVYKLRIHPNGPVVAVKALRPVGICTDSVAGLNRFCKRLLREVQLGSSLRHRNVAQLNGFAIIDGRPSLISPWCKHGNIRQYLKQGSPPLNYGRRLELLRQVAGGLKYLHLHAPVVDNVLINDQEEAQLCDYGLSRFIDDTQLAIFFTSRKSDIYSFASLGLEVMTDRIPFTQLTSDFQVMTAIVTSRTPMPSYYPELPASDALWDLFRTCWSYSPEARPTIKTVWEKVSLQGQVVCRI